MKFQLESQFEPTGDQPRAIKKLTQGLKKNKKNQVLLGVTGSGKTFTISNVIKKTGRPTLIISHNKTLAAQLFQEFREFFPQNAVHYFVSYYDYYQPEAYIPNTDTYIEKDASINEDIERLRHGATQAVLSRSDTIIIASVSCIYGIGEAKEYKSLALRLNQGDRLSPKKLMENLVDLQYERNQTSLTRSIFRRRANTVEIIPAFTNSIIKIHFQDKKISKISRRHSPLLEQESFLNSKDGEDNVDQEPEKVKAVKIWPAEHYVTREEKLKIAIQNIKKELKKRIKELKRAEKNIEAERLKKKTRHDIEMLKETGYCKGIENYSRHLTGRDAGEPPETLIDYFHYSYGEDWLMVIDESHKSIPQIGGMYEGDQSRKQNLIEHGFRLPSAKDNRPLKFSEFEKKMPQTIYMSATPGDYEFKKASQEKITNLTEFEKKAQKNLPSPPVKNKNLNKQKAKPTAPEKYYVDINGIVEQLIRPTGLTDPTIEIRPTSNQIKDLIGEIKKATEKDQRVLVTTITQKLAENIANYLQEEEIKALWLHAEIPTLERPEILKKLRKGKIDVIVGINLLREGLDLPEVSLVAILDADKEGFLRNETTLIQTMGRAARHPEGRTILYADNKTQSIQNAIFETRRRRKIQEAYNKIHEISPSKIERPIRERVIPGYDPGKEEPQQDKTDFKSKALADLKKEMEEAADNLNFEKAARLRDRIKEMRNESNQES